MDFALSACSAANASRVKRWLFSKSGPFLLSHWLGKLEGAEAQAKPNRDPETRTGPSSVAVSGMRKLPTYVLCSCTRDVSLSLRFGTLPLSQRPTSPASSSASRTYTWHPKDFGGRCQEGQPWRPGTSAEQNRFSNGRPDVCEVLGS